MSQPTPVRKRVIVLGDAPEAARAASELVALGYAVQWATPASEPDAAPVGITTYAGYRLTALRGSAGAFTAELRRETERLTLTSSAVVVAYANETFFPAKRYRLPLSGNVLSVPQLQRRLDEQARVNVAAVRNRRLALVLDWVRETPKELATAALRLVGRVRQAWHCDVSVYYQNLKVDTAGLEAMTRAMRQQGIVFCRYGTLKVSAGEDSVWLTSEEGRWQGDLLVLPEAVRPRSDAAALATALGVRLGSDGYLQDVNIHQHRTGQSTRRGVFFAGRSHMDGAEEDFLADAVQAAANVDELLGAGWLACEPVLAHVDPDKCVRCLTCVRSCPHAAVEVVQQADVLAAQVIEPACWGCGLCVSNCPARAIELLGQQAPAWL